MTDQKLSPMADTLISVLDTEEEKKKSGKITVNPLISKFASWYERFRNAMDYREEEVVLRAAIERILKRRIILGGTGEKIAEPLIRELVWARYFPDDSLSESVVSNVRNKIDLYLDLRSKILSKHGLSEPVVSEWMYQLLSADIEQMLNRNKIKQVMSSFMFQIMRNHVIIEDDSEQNKDVQVFIAVRRSFARDDLAFLRYHLFQQYFGQLTQESLEDISMRYKDGYTEIQSQLHYARKETIHNYIKSKTAVFFILEDLFRVFKGSVRELFTHEEELSRTVFTACQVRYASISDKVRRAIVRSVIFILITKVFFAFTIEGTIESILYGKILWGAMAINVVVPPILMVIVGLLIRPPGIENSKRILSYIQEVLFNPNPQLGSVLKIRKNPEKAKPIMRYSFTVLWTLTFLLSFGVIVFILTQIGMNPVSQTIFIFFLTIVSFLSYRINLMSKVYTVEQKQGSTTPVVDFLFMPIIQVGYRLTDRMSQVNVLLFIFDFLIETPFKGMFSFFEQWFFFLHAKREELE